MDAYAVYGNDWWTWHEVQIVLLNHSMPVAEFLEEFGRRDKYKARAVLGWLGY